MFSPRPRRRRQISVFSKTHSTNHTTHTQVSNQWFTLSVFKPVTPMAFCCVCVCVCVHARVCISMEANPADDEPTTWLRSSLRATEVTFTPWQEMWRAINLPMHIHRRTRTHAMNNCDVLGCRPYLTRGYTLVCGWGKLDHLESIRTAPFSIYLGGVRLFCPGETRQWSRMPTSWIYLNSSAKHNLL